MSHSRRQQPPNSRRPPHLIRGKGGGGGVTGISAGRTGFRGDHGGGGANEHLHVCHVVSLGSVSQTV